MFDESLTKHVILQACMVGPYSFWHVGEPGTSVFFAEVGILYGGRRIIVHGDVDEVLLWGYTAPEVVASRDRSMLSWAAHSQADYIATKALFPKGRAWDRDIALYDLKDMHRTACKEHGKESIEAELVLPLIEGVENGYEHEWLMHQAYDSNILDSEDVEHVGMCVPHSIIMAQQVLRKLLTLLEKESS